MTHRSNPLDDAAIASVPGQVSTRRRFVPNVPVVSHHGHRYMFYDDLVKDRTVIVHFFNLTDHPGYPVTRNLVSVQQLLGERLGTSVSMISITTDPQRDNESQIAEFAARHHARSGWTFLTGEPSAVEAIQGIFFNHGSGQSGHDHNAVPDCSLGLLRYGNDRAGLWGSVPTKSDPAQIVARLDWIDPPAMPSAHRLKRRGPLPLTT